MYSITHGKDYTRNQWLEWLWLSPVMDLRKVELTIHGADFIEFFEYCCNANLPYPKGRIIHLYPNAIMVSRIIHWFDPDYLDEGRPLYPSLIIYPDIEGGRTDEIHTHLKDLLPDDVDLFLGHSEWVLPHTVRDRLIILIEQFHIYSES